MVSRTTRPQVPFDEDEVDDLTIEYPSSDGEPWPNPTGSTSP